MAVPSSTVNWDSIVSTTLNNTRAQRYDNIFRKSAFWARMHLNGRKELVDGGVNIQRAVEYAVNGTVKSFNGYDQIDLTPQEILTSATDTLKEVAGSVVISRREERQNSGRSQIVSLIESKISNLDRSFAQKLNEMILAPSGSSQTAGNSGKDLNPLPVIIAGSSGTTLHNINATTYTWWEPQRQASSATSFATFKQELRHTYNLCGRNNDGFPDFVLTSQDGFEQYEEALEGQVRYGSTEMANLGFDTVMLKGAEVAWDQICPGTSANAAAFVNYDDATYAEENFYFINTDFLKLLVDTQSDLVNRPFMDSQDQTAKSALVIFMGELFCTNRRTQGLLYGVDVSAINA